MPILVTYASDHGSTREIAESISSHLAEQLPPTEVVPLADVNPSTIPTYTAIVIGSAIHGTRWLPNAVSFLHNNSTALAGIPVYAFSVGAPAAMPKFCQGRWQKKEEKHIRKAIEKELKADHPVLREHHLFNGKFEKEHANWCLRTLLCCFGGHFGDFRNWEEVQKWANEIAEDLKKPVEEQGGN